ncbi:MAG: c-type cytochrome [Rhodobacteraceae bacterium]|nr:c-type cytochrome [Paracoccaceae bacterium]
MTRPLRTALAALLALAPAGAAPAADGEALYVQNCALCHTVDGRGFPPGIPALKGSANLADPFTLVANTHAGGAYMPPFPALGAEEIAAIATYVRGAWGNGLGPVTTEEVAALMATTADAAAPAPRTIWDGVYSRDQAARGQQVARGACGLCHGSRLNGVPDDNDMKPGPPLARAYFLRVWDGRTLGAAFTYSKWTMPQANPGFLPDEDYAAVVAYMLSLTGAPPGAEPLPADARALGYITIGPKP